MVLMGYVQGYVTRSGAAIPLAKVFARVRLPDGTLSALQRVATSDYKGFYRFMEPIDTAITKMICKVDGIVVWTNPSVPFTAQSDPPRTVNIAI